MQSGLDGAQVLDEGIAEDSFQTTKKRGRKRAAFQHPPETSSRRRTSARDVLPIDDELHQYFPCPVAVCKAVFHNRAERSFHIRTDHVGYKYKPGDGMEKIRNLDQMNYEEDDVILDVGSISDHSVERKQIPDDPLSDYSEEHEQRYQLSLGEHKNPSWHGDHMMSGPSHDDEFMIARISKKHGEIDVNTFPTNADLFRVTKSGPKRRGRPKNPPGAEPAACSKVRVPDPNGKYRCYIPDCPWKGGYRSIRAEHMKWVHKDWKMPPRYVLQRMSRDGEFYNKDPEGDFACLVEGCLWRGNYRASRSSHMRSQHPEWQPAKKKAPTGGYIEDGKYLCHDTNCGWRGASRSTRAAHMKRAHPGFLNPVFQPRMLLCPDCNVQCCTHKTFVDHLVNHHKIGGSVQREFAGIQDYEEWYEAVQDAFSVEFIKKMGVKQNESYQITYLYCARGGGTRLKQTKQHPYSSQYVKVKNLARPFRSRNHCAAFLRVLHWTDGKLTVYGCVEHTGHRLGTSILRLSPAERDIMEEFIYVNDDDNPMEQMLYKFKENYVVEGYPLPPYDEAILTESIHDKNNEILSLKSLVKTFPADSTFNVNIPEKSLTDGDVCDLSLGIMTDEMKVLWTMYCSKVVCFEEVRLIIGNWNLSLIFVLVFVEDNSPRCCCIYLSNATDRISVLKHLYEVSPQPPQAIITDHLLEWPLILESIYGESAYSIELLTADWHLLAEWADSLDKIVQNRVDRFTIFACLRRWLRVTDPALFDAYIVEMFEAFRELNLDDMTHRIDMALIDPENFKRWNPLSRTTPLTEHHNPIVDIAYRHFREHFLNAESCTRLDQYIGLLMSRIPVFNKCTTSEPVAHGIIEPMRPLPISENIAPNTTVLADGSIVIHEDNPEELIIESELDENGHPYIVDEKDGIIGGVIQEEIVEEFAEDIEEEEIVDMSDIPSTSGIVYEEQGQYIDPSSTSYELVEEIPADNNQARKNRVSMLLQTIQKNPSSLTGRHLDLLESSLSEVVDQLDHSAQHE